MIATERTTAERRGVDLELIRRFVSLARPYWLHGAGLLPWLGVLLIVFASIASPYLNLFKADYLRDQTNALAAYRRAAFYVTIGLSFGNEIVMAVLASSADFVGGRLAVAWRRALSHQITALYFCRRAYYVFQCNPLLDNPDERIGEDIRLATASTVDMLTFVITFISGVFAFSGTTWAGVGWWSVLLIAYSLAGTVIIANRFGVLADLNAGRLRIEANFRYGLVRIREHAEAIAFLQGERRELAIVRGLFDAVAGNTKDILLRTAQFKFAQIVFGLGLSIIPTVYLTSRYFAHQIDLGTIGQLQFAVGASAITLTSFVSSFSQISVWAAQINRLYEMRERLRENDRREARNPAPRISYNGDVRLEAADIDDPAGRLLVRDLSFDLEPRASLVVTGPNGCGKSSLLRVLAGLWPARKEALTLPPLARVMFVSQKPYMTLGDLRVQLSYPHDPGAVSDDAYASVLRRVGLARLLEDSNGLDAARNWSGELSLGEQQLVAIARILLASPELALLDEATSALDPPSERRCYRALHESGVTLISVAHRPELIPLHDVHLELGLPNASWRLTRAGAGG